MRRRPLLFLLIASAIMISAYVYIAWRLAESPLLRGLLAVPFVLIWAMPVLFWGRAREHATWHERLVQWGSYLSMAIVSFLAVVTVLRDAVLLATLPWPDAGWRLALASAAGGTAMLWTALGLTLAGAAVAVTGPRVHRVDVPLADLPPGLEGLTVAQLSDLHVGPTIGRRYVARVVARTNALAADLVALTGDIFDGPLAEMAPHAEALGQLAPRGRVYFVPGNHEYYWNAAGWIQWFERRGATTLLNRGEVVEVRGAKVLVAGVTDPAARLRDQGVGPDPAKAAQGSDGAAVKLLLAHQPGVAQAAAAAGFDLQLSGHTHAGQFFPWTLVVRFVHRHYAGLSRAGRLWVYVSPGTGTWGPPVRLGTRPEITLLRLVKA